MQASPYGAGLSDPEMYAVFCEYCNGESAFVVSSETLRTIDLIPAFMDALRDAGFSALASDIEADYPDVFDALDNSALEYAGLAEDAGFLMEDLYAALNDIAPAGFYFGSSDGDGALFGFWSA